MGGSSINMPRRHRMHWDYDYCEYTWNGQRVKRVVDSRTKNRYGL
jgi:hypothetical protein